MESENLFQLFSKVLTFELELLIVLNENGKLKKVKMCEISLIVIYAAAHEFF